MKYLIEYRCITKSSLDMTTWGRGTYQGPHLVQFSAIWAEYKAVHPVDADWMEDESYVHDGELYWKSGLGAKLFIGKFLIDWYCEPDNIHPYDTVWQFRLREQP